MRFALRTHTPRGVARWAPPLILAVLGLVLCGPATAQAQQDDAATAAVDQAEAEPEPAPPTLDVTVDVTATLPEVDRLIAAEGQRVGAAEGAQLISADYMKAQQASTLADALRKTTSVQVDEEGGQQGSLVIIRGLSQDQVSVRVEGAPKNFNQARHGGAGTVWLEPDIYKSLVVVPGVASNVYGNGSLGGVILLETKDPEDVMRPGAAHGANVRTGYESNGESLYVSSDTAYRFNESFAVNATYTRRDTAQYRDGAGNLSLGGATGTDDHNVLLKGALTPADAGRLELSYVGLRKDYTARGGRSRGLLVSSVDEFTNVQEDTYTAQYAFNPPDRLWFDMNVRASLHRTGRDRRADGSTTPTTTCSPRTWRRTAAHRSRVGLDVSRRADKLFEPDVRFSRIGFTTVDLFGMYQLNDALILRARAANLTNELYTKRYRNLSIDLDGRPQDLTYYQPGRNVKLTLEFVF